jgi:hypothetical protein
MSRFVLPRFSSPQAFRNAVVTAGSASTPPPCATAPRLAPRSCASLVVSVSQARIIRALADRWPEWRRAKPTFARWTTAFANDARSKAKSGTAELRRSTVFSHGPADIRAGFRLLQACCTGGELPVRAILRVKVHSSVASVGRSASPETTLPLTRSRVTSRDS